MKKFAWLVLVLLYPVYADCAISKSTILCAENRISSTYPTAITVRDISLLDTLFPEANNESRDSIIDQTVVPIKHIELTPCEIKPIDNLYVNFNISPLFLDIRHKELTGATPTHPDIISYEWDMGDGSKITGSEFQHIYDIANKPAEYIVKLTVTNDATCTKTASKTVQVIPFIPNVFTPNGDGTNDLFMPHVSLQIIDRYGRVLYKGNEGWDGTYKGKIADRDTYFYLIEFIGTDSKLQTHKGYITLEK